MKLDPTDEFDQAILFDVNLEPTDAFDQTAKGETKNFNFKTKKRYFLFKHCGKIRGEMCTVVQYI